MNREERRKYTKKIAKDRRASICPICGNKSLFFSSWVATEPDQGEGGKSGPPGMNHKPAIICEFCNKPVIIDERIYELLPAGYYNPNLGIEKVYVPIPLDIFLLALKSPIEEEENND